MNYFLKVNVPEFLLLLSTNTGFVTKANHVYQLLLRFIHYHPRGSAFTGFALSSQLLI